MPYSNEYTELIYDFLDGELPQSEETRLFAAFLHDADVRMEFKQILLINAAIQNDTQAFTPSPESDNAIFTRLGFAKNDTTPLPVPLPPIAATTAAPSIINPSLMARVYPTLRRVGLIALIALLSSGLTAWFLGNYWNASNDGLWGNSALSNSALTQNTILPPNSTSYQGLNSFSSMRPHVDTVYADTLFRTRTIVQRVVVVQYDSSFALNGAQNLASSGFDAQNTRSLSNASIPLTNKGEIQTPLNTLQSPSNQASVADASSIHSFAQQDSLPLGITPKAAPLLGLSIGARGVVSRSVIWANVAPATEAFPTNTSLFALYSLNAQHSIGIEAGRESFFQRFFYTDERGVEYRVEQHPTLLWGGLAYRFALLPEQVFSPFAHVVLGATQVSAMGRGMIGLTYTPDARTQFLLGAEASSLFFQSGGTLYMAPKLGISYGVSVKF
jgi:hypothetical protein